MPEINRIRPATRYSRAVIHNGIAYLSGLTADDGSGDVTAQTGQVLAKADRLLADIGTNRARLLSATIYLSDIAEFNAMNAAWEAWVDPDHLPARATVESKLASPDLRVEIQFIAVID